MSEPLGVPRSRLVWWLALAAVLGLAGWLRMHDLESFRIGPDDGAYLHSARIHELARGGNPLAWIGDDVAWARELARLYSDQHQTYQHSYLHQLGTRWLYRLGFGALESLRLSSAITGSLTVLFVAWLVLRLLPARRWLAVLAAAFVAVSPLHAFLSRTGWGQAGFTCWYLAFLVYAHRALVARPEPDARVLRFAALGMIATSVLAYGWHEGVVPYVAGTALVAFAAPWVRGEGWSARAVLASRRTWAYVAGASVVGAFTLALFFSTFAQAYWLTTKGRSQDMAWLELKGRTLQNVFAEQRLDQLLTWPMLLLALLGLAWLRRTDRVAFRWLLANALAGPVLLFFLFGDAFLVRAYLPSYVLLLVCAACGVAWVADRLGHAAGALVGSLVLALTAATAWQSLFGRHLGPVFVQKLYDQTNQLDHRHVDEPLYDLLVRERKPDELVGVFSDKACIYKLLDRGIRAQEDYMENRPRETWPVWIVGVAGQFERSPFFAGNGGPYVLRAKDAVGRHALYQRVER
ncbi:MAG: hypothetical protein NTY35_11640 [Planctomycetota bacterium]|nr:hypothetical protein [Planctomycetota bacterium]